MFEIWNIYVKDPCHLYASLLQCCEYFLPWKCPNLKKKFTEI